MFSILTRAGDSASIPCLATDPRVVNLRLEPCHGGALPNGLHYAASLERGMVIYDTKKAFEGCYICTGRLSGALVKSHSYDLTVRPGKIALTVRASVHVGTNTITPVFVFWDVKYCIRDIVYLIFSHVLLSPRCAPSD